MKTQDIEHSSSFSDVTFWTWVAAAVMLLLVFAAIFAPSNRQRVAENTSPTAVEGMMPPITQPAPNP